MELITPKRRREIYLLAAVLIEQKLEKFCCRAIQKVLGFHIDDFYLPEFIKNNFPEFEMFNPDPEYADAGDVWFSSFDKSDYAIFYSHAETNKQRLFCLLFCAEIIEQEIEIK